MPHFEAPVHLREGYEKLREGVLSSEPFTATSGGGLAVFVQQGMAAWMKVYALVVDRQPLVELSRGADELVPEGLLEEVTSLLATLLVQRKECVE